MKLDYTEILFVRAAVGAATINASDAPKVAQVIVKLDKEQDRLEKLEAAKK